MTDLEARVERLEEELGIIEKTDSDLLKRVKHAFYPSNSFEDRGDVVKVSYEFDVYNPNELTRMRRNGLQIHKITEKGIIVEDATDD